MTAFANYLAVNHEIRATQVDWTDAEKRMRIACGFEWDADQSRQRCEATKARAAQIRKECQAIRAMRNFGRGA